MLAWWSYLSAARAVLSTTACDSACGWLCTMAMPASSGYPNSRAALASACAAADPAGIRSDRPPDEGSGGRNSTASTTAAAQPRTTGNRNPTMRYANAFATKAPTTPQRPTFTN